MAEYHGQPLVPPRLAPFWTDTKARLRSSRLRQILTGRLDGGWPIYTASEARPAEEPGGVGGWWARLVLTPVQTPWQQEDQPGRELFVRWLVVVEAHAPTGMAYDPLVTLEAAHLEAFQLLHGWVPGLHQRYNGRFPVVRQTPPQPMPFYEQAEDIWYTSAEYGVLLSPVEADYGE